METTANQCQTWTYSLQTSKSRMANPCSPKKLTASVKALAAGSAIWLNEARARKGMAVEAGNTSELGRTTTINDELFELFVQA